MKTLRCGRCRQDIGIFDPGELAKPLTSEMFKPKAPNYPPPFSPGQEWPFLLCTFCGMCVTMDPRRPGQHPDFVMTPEGLFDFANPPPDVSEEVEPGHVCPNCQKVLKSKGGLGNHMRFCKGT